MIDKLTNLKPAQTNSAEIMEQRLAPDSVLASLVDQQIEGAQAFRFLIYLNAIAFLLVFLAANGLAVSSLIQIVVWVYSLLSLVLLINLLSATYPKFSQSKVVVSGRLGASYLIYDCALAGILITNSFSEQSAPTPVAVIAVVAAGFMSLAVSPRTISEFVFGKTVLLLASIYVLMIDSAGNTTLIFPLLVAFVLMSVSAYGVFTMRVKVLQQGLEQQQMLLQLQKETHLRERLLVYVGHDLRQPINALGMLLHALPPEDQNVLDAKECVRSSKRLIDGVVDNAQFEKELVADKEPFQLQSLFDSIKLEYSFAANQADCELRIVETSCVINDDRRFVARIVKNFVANAVTHAGSSSILVGARRRPQSIDILVLDNGSGIREDEKDILFNEFMKGQATAPEVGMGLGLAIAKHYALVCGSEILFSSELNKGSIFGLRIPT